MYKLVNELRDLAQGFYPLADNFPMVDKNGDIEGISEHQIDEAVERMRVSILFFFLIYLNLVTVTCSICKRDFRVVYHSYCTCLL